MRLILIFVCENYLFIYKYVIGVFTLIKIKTLYVIFLGILKYKLTILL